jgi:Domain of unknown function (DUF4419)
MIPLVDMRISLWDRSASHRPLRFAVDDVTPSNEVLATSDCLAAMQAKLARKIVASPVTGRQVVAATTECSNPLVGAMHLAFSRHLPLTLSPDAIWLTIVQGFSHHVNQFPEAFRGRLVRHQGKCDLEEQINEWGATELAVAVSGFSRQIREATDPAIHDALTCNFTTTTDEARTASEIAIMDTYSHYFRYTIARCVCGIPEIALTGSVEDWQRMRERIEIFETFDMNWWVERMRPILDQFVLAAAGEPDREFWQGMYKFRPKQGVYSASTVTGWVVDLFPYLGKMSNRERNHAFDDGGDREVISNRFPEGLCKVSVRLKLMDGHHRELYTRDLDLVAGLFGLQQLDTGLAPVISWCLIDPSPPEEPAFRTRISPPDLSPKKSA